jgi:hypothetical protein
MSAIVWIWNFLKGLSLVPLGGGRTFKMWDLVCVGSLKSLEAYPQRGLWESLLFLLFFSSCHKVKIGAPGTLCHDMLPHYRAN